jgi:predicted DNA-binding protein (MmcQ/YjbR family)
MITAELQGFRHSLEQALESFSFGKETPVFRVRGNGKIFALSAMKGVPLNVSLKVDPEDSVWLSPQPGSIGSHSLTRDFRSL